MDASSYRQIHRIAMAGFVCRRCCSNPSSRWLTGPRLTECIMVVQSD
ncbi:hypothetical protein Bphy_2830 [Paraburkholderia phymatum STM815]|uniref:Uncharacterized protein n=1 Tax=Paraburkholderia phymatum (strain DSM 17167 / CIP 108236 / LMG 21445 / STM815) TaxID=391038 RepID=B2JI56_PARP8|nr:hypothetical protein Bphy_2830 [Paraburkholderia phymatum STM815]